MSISNINFLLYSLANQFQEVDHLNDFYKPRLEELGYDTHTAFRREKDAVLVGFKKD